MVTIKESTKVDIVKVEGNSLIHKQIEKRGDFTFMRLRKRALLFDIGPDTPEI